MGYAQWLRALRKRNTTCCFAADCTPRPHSITGVKTTKKQRAQEVPCIARTA